MLRTLGDFKHLSIGAIDGTIGNVTDAYFDDQSWTVRYLVVDTGGWLGGRRVLITPLAIEQVRWSDRLIDVHMTREQVKNSPDIDTDKPVSRQHEMLFLNYYGLPHYWGGPMLWGPTATPHDIGEVRTEPLRTDNQMPSVAELSDDGDPHLRSCSEVSGYHVEARDGSIGHIGDYLFDEDTWTIRYLVIDTRHWLPGKRVVISSEWVERVSWNERKAYMAIARQSIRDAPEYDRDLTVREHSHSNLSPLTTQKSVEREHRLPH